jgi:hypothetical protein
VFTRLEDETDIRMARNPNLVSTEKFNDIGVIVTLRPYVPGRADAQAYGVTYPLRCEADSDRNSRATNAKFNQ